MKRFLDRVTIFFIILALIAWAIIGFPFKADALGLLIPFAVSPLIVKWLIFGTIKNED